MRGPICSVAEQHPGVHSYVKNKRLGFEVLYTFNASNRLYEPDFLLRIDDYHGEDNLLHLTVEVKGYRREDARLKREAMETRWIPAINCSSRHGRWASPSSAPSICSSPSSKNSSSRFSTMSSRKPSPATCFRLQEIVLLQLRRPLPTPPRAPDGPLRRPPPPLCTRSRPGATFRRRSLSRQCARRSNDRPACPMSGATPISIHRSSGQANTGRRYGCLAATNRAGTAALHPGERCSPGWRSTI